VMTSSGFRPAVCRLPTMLRRTTRAWASVMVTPSLPSVRAGSV
jgi:hypothetical protein